MIFARKCLNFTQQLPEKYFPDFFLGGAHAPQPPLTPSPSYAYGL